MERKIQEVQQRLQKLSPAEVSRLQGFLENPSLVEIERTFESVTKLANLLDSL